MRRLPGWGRIIGFGGSVPVIVLVLAEQVEGLGGLSQNPDRFRTAHLNFIGITLPGENVRDPINGGFEPDRIACCGAGNDQFQPVLTAAAEGDEPFLRRRGCLLLSAGRVGLIDGGLQQGLQSPPRTPHLRLERSVDRPSRLA